MELNIKEFTRGLVAALVNEDVASIRPKRAEQRKGLRQVWHYLSKEVERARKSKTRDEAWLKQVIRLRNAMTPGPTGAFDQFETALRDLQLSFTESPNPSYEDIDFTVSKPFARSRLDQFDERSKQLIKQAAQVFISHSDDHAQYVSRA